MSMINVNAKVFYNLLPLAFATLLFFPSGACAENGNAGPVSNTDGGSISGRVTDQSEDSVVGAKIEIVSGPDAFSEGVAETDGIGSYYFENLPAGTYEIAVHDHDGERVAQASITVQASESATLDIVVKGDKKDMSKPKQYSSPPPMIIDRNKSYIATIHLEKGGEMVAELYPKEAPITVNSFVFLAREGFYDGVTFFRVINLGPGLIAQTGDPTNTGMGGPGYEFDNETNVLRRHDRPGVLSMANAGIRGGHGTNGSQFFIAYASMGFLDGHDTKGSPKNCSSQGTSCHTVFGLITQGFDVLTTISQRDPSTASSPGDVIRTITIEEGN